MYCIEEYIIVCEDGGFGKHKHAFSWILNSLLDAILLLQLFIIHTVHTLHSVQVVPSCFTIPIRSFENSLYPVIWYKLVQTGIYKML